MTSKEKQIHSKGFFPLAECVDGRMSRCGCDRVSVQQLPVQLRPRLRKKQRSCSNPPHSPGFTWAMGGLGKKNLSQNLTDISHLWPSSHFVTGFVWFFLSFLQKQDRLFHPTILASSSGGGVYTEITGSAAEFVSPSAPTAKP